MSGGSHGYIYSQMQDELCGHMHDAELNDLMKDVVDLAHDLEWYDSSDISEESYKKTVTEFKKKWLADRDDRLNEIYQKELENDPEIAEYKSGWNGCINHITRGSE